MELEVRRNRRRGLWAALAAAALICAVVLLRGPLFQIGGLALGAGVVGFVALPLAKLFEQKLSRSAAALSALCAIGLAVAGVAALLLPALLRELMELTRTLPATISSISGWLRTVSAWLARRLPGIALPALNPDALQGAVAGIAGGTVGFAVNAADVIGRASLMAVLAYFFLRDRDALLLRLELLVPQRHRHIAVRIGNAVCRELRLYLRGQLMIAAAVSLLSIVALSLVGLKSAVLMGTLIGALNMIPYFGPFIGGVPAVLIAVGDGWKRAALTVVALNVVQQLDGAWISPRIMGSLTGFSPPLVLVGIYAGARLGGVPGMLLAMPVMMACRTAFRIFVQKCENN